MIFRWWKKERKVIVMIVDSVALPRDIWKSFSDVNQQRFPTQKLLHFRCYIMFSDTINWWPSSNRCCLLLSAVNVKTNYWVDLKGQQWSAEVKKPTSSSLCANNRRPAACYLIVDERNIKISTVTDKVCILFNCCSILIGRKRHCTLAAHTHPMTEKKRRKCVFTEKLYKIDGMFKCF